MLRAALVRQAMASSSSTSMSSSSSSSAPPPPPPPPLLSVSGAVVTTEICFQAVPPSTRAADTYGYQRLTVHVRLQIVLNVQARWIMSLWDGETCLDSLSCTCSAGVRCSTRREHAPRQDWAPGTATTHVIAYVLLSRGHAHILASEVAAGGQTLRAHRVSTQNKCF